MAMNTEGQGVHICFAGHSGNQVCQKHIRWKYTDLTGSRGGGGWRLVE